MTQATSSYLNRPLREITRLYTRHYSDNGQTKTYVDWSDGSRTEWDSGTSSAHAAALIERAYDLGIKHERENW